MQTLPVTFRLPTACYTAIGRGIVRWSFLELRLKQIAYKLLSVGPKEGRVAVREPRVADYITMIEDLIELRGLAVGFDFRQLRKMAIVPESLRDWMAHGIFLRDRQTKRILLQVTKGKWQPDPKAQKSISRKKKPEGFEVDARKLNRLTWLIDRTLSRINTLEREIDAALAASQQKSTSPSG